MLILLQIGFIFCAFIFLADMSFILVIYRPIKGIVHLGFLLFLSGLSYSLGFSSLSLVMNSWWTIILGIVFCSIGFSLGIYIQNQQKAKKENNEHVPA